MHTEMHIWPGTMFELWATFRHFKQEEETRVVAHFLSQESASAYLEGSRLKSGGFRKSSLLCDASAAWIEEAEEIPIEPTL